MSGYKQFEYLKAELKDMFAMADVIISRAGANAICELLALKKPNLLVPLPAGSSRDLAPEREFVSEKGLSLYFRMEAAFLNADGEEEVFGIDRGLKAEVCLENGSFTITPGEMTHISPAFCSTGSGFFSGSAGFISFPETVVFSVSWKTAGYFSCGCE